MMEGEIGYVVMCALVGFYSLGALVGYIIGLGKGLKLEVRSPKAKK